MYNKNGATKQCKLCGSSYVWTGTRQLCCGDKRVKGTCQYIIKVSRERERLRLLRPHFGYGETNCITCGIRFTKKTWSHAKCQECSRRVFNPRKYKSGRKSRLLKLRFMVFERDSFTCQYCGRKAPEFVLQVDHIIPRSRGGTNSFGNYRTACVDCNIGKRDAILVSQ